MELRYEPQARLGKAAGRRRERTMGLHGLFNMTYKWPHPTPQAEREVEESFENTREAFVLLDLIDSEFRTDPSPVQCFDPRVVRRVRECVTKRKKFVMNNLVYGRT